MDAESLKIAAYIENVQNGIHTERILIIVEELETAWLNQNGGTGHGKYARNSLDMRSCFYNVTNGEVTDVRHDIKIEPRICETEYNEISLY